MKELIELFTTLSLQNILMIGGIILIVLVNIHSSSITIKHPKLVFIFGLLLLVAGIGMHLAPRLPPSVINSTPELLRPLAAKVYQFLSKPKTEEKELVTLHQQEKKKLFDEQFAIAAKKISAAQVLFSISDCAENAGMTYCTEGTYAVDKRREGIYAGQGYNYFISITQISADVDSVSFQIRKESQQAKPPVQPKG